MLIKKTKILQNKLFRLTPRCLWMRIRLKRFRLKFKIKKMKTKRKNSVSGWYRTTCQRASRAFLDSTSCGSCWLECTTSVSSTWQMWGQSANLKPTATKCGKTLAWPGSICCSAYTSRCVRDKLSMDCLNLKKAVLCWEVMIQRLKRPTRLGTTHHSCLN